MAKAKKSDEAKKPEAAKKSAPAAAGGEKGMAKAKVPASKPAATKSKTGRGGGAGTGAAPATPMIDTNLAARAAARMLAAGLPSRKTATSPGPEAGGVTPAGGKQQQSAMFRQLKDGLSKPHLSGMDSVLDKGAAPGSKRPNLPTGNERVGHNQTFGADVNRAGVPRRTPG